jgi:hypothetical protein
MKKPLIKTISTGVVASLAVSSLGCAVGAARGVDVVETSCRRCELPHIDITSPNVGYAIPGNGQLVLVGTATPFSK